MTVFPAALDAFPNLSALSALVFLERWPTVAAAGPLSQADIEAFLRHHRHGQARTAAARIDAALQAEALVAPVHLVRATAGAIQLAAPHRLLLHRQRAAWEAQLRDLLHGEQAHPDGEVLVSPAPSWEHQRLLDLLYTQLAAWTAARSDAFTAGIAPTLEQFVGPGLFERVTWTGEVEARALPDLRVILP